MKLSFIIVNYRSKKYLEKCIVSLFEKITGLDFEIIVVNNDKDKLGVLSVRESFLYKITVVEINKNVGFAKANNVGVSKSGGDYICFINPDTEVISENVEALINEFNFDKNIGVIGPKILKEKIVQPWSVGADMDIWEILKGKLGFPKSKDFWCSNEKTEVGWVSGASLFIKKELFLAVGGFDEKFFLYYEDVDLCKRIKTMDKKIIYYPFFLVKHLEGKSSKKRYRQKIEYFKSQDYYYKKWFNQKIYWVMKFFRFFYLLRYKIIR